MKNGIKYALGAGLCLAAVAWAMLAYAYWQYGELLRRFGDAG